MAPSQPSPSRPPQRLFLPPQRFPSLILHADWSAGEKKRWAAVARKTPYGYQASAPFLVRDSRDLFRQIWAEAQPGPILAGFDFPIGFPLSYAQNAGIDSFLEILPCLGYGDWADFYRPAQHPSEINLHRPFYPAKPGSACLQDLWQTLALPSAESLRRVCDLGCPVSRLFPAGQRTRRPAAPLFWTLGAQQVGKAAIHGWQTLLAPALSTDEPYELSVWPFQGRLYDLLEPGSLVVAETYPAEVYIHLGFKFQRTKQTNPGNKDGYAKNGSRTAYGKRSQAARLANASALFAFAERAGLLLDPDLNMLITSGFGASPDGEDRFDAVVGLFGLLGVVLAKLPFFEPRNPQIRAIEGWILGMPDPET